MDNESPDTVAACMFRVLRPVYPNTERRPCMSGFRPQRVPKISRLICCPLYLDYLHFSNSISAVAVKGTCLW